MHYILFVQQKFISGARFGFVLDEELKAAASDEEVRSALGNKISKERIGHEVILVVVVIFLLKFVCFRVMFREKKASL